MNEAYIYTVISGKGLSHNYSYDFYTDEETITETTLDALTLREKISSNIGDLGNFDYIIPVNKISIVDKLISILPPVPCDEDGMYLQGEVKNPYLSWKIKTNRILDEAETEVLLKYIHYHCHAGWGDNFGKQRVSVNEDGRGIYYYPYNEENWSTKVFDIVKVT